MKKKKIEILQNHIEDRNIFWHMLDLLTACQTQREKQKVKMKTLTEEEKYRLKKHDMKVNVPSYTFRQLKGKVLYIY